MARFSFCGPSYESQSPWEDAEKCMNMIPEVMEVESAKSRVSLYEVPGYATFADINGQGISGSIRGQLAINGRQFVVCGATLVELASNGTATNRGTVANDSNPVSMVSSLTQLLIVSANNVYVLTLANNQFQKLVQFAAPPSFPISTTAGAGLTLGTQTGSLTSISEAGTTVTLVTDVALVSQFANVAPGDAITIAGVTPSGYNGTFTIVSIDPGDSISGRPATITYSASAGLGAGSGGTWKVYTLNVLTVGSPNFTVGEEVTITGAANSAYNGSWFVMATQTPGIGGNGSFLHCPSSLAGTSASQSGTIAATVGLPAQCGYCDDFFLLMLNSLQKWQVSGVGDATSWNDIDVSQVSTMPDQLVAMLVDHREVWFFGASKSVVYFDSGNIFPFDVVSGGYIEQGCAAAFSPVRADNSIFWIGADDRGQAVCWRANGYTPQRVSNYGVENAWNGYSTVSDALSWSYQENGHTFVVFEFPTASATWVYDVSTGMWHERGQWNGTSYGAMNLGWHSFCFGKHLVGDRTTGKIYQMSSSITGFLGDGGTALRWLRIAPWISDESTWTRHDSLQFDCSGGTINLQWSDDGTATWSTVRTVTASANQGNLTRLIFRRLGRSRGRIYQAYGTTPVKIMDAYLRATGYEKPTQRLATKIGQMA